MLNAFWCDFTVIFSVFLIYAQCAQYVDVERSFCGAEGLNCSGTCISNTLICDGTKDCEDGADEYFWLCKNQRCPDYAYKCLFGECLSREQVCDGIENCREGYDENFHVCLPMFPDCGEFDSDDLTDIFPWHAAIWKETKEGPVKICASTIVAPKFLISTADCFWNFTSNNLSQHVFTATAELVNNIFKQARKIKYIYTNNYHSTENETGINNIAVVELEQSFTFNDLTSAACLFDYKRPEMRLSYSHFYSEMVTWSPGPFNYNEPKRIALHRHLNGESLIAEARRSEISNVATKYVSSSNTCGPLSDHGGGTFLRLNNLYYLESVINAPLGDVSIMNCLDRIHTYVLPHTSFIRATVNDDHTLINVTETPSNKYALDVEIEAPKSLFPDCGKFDLFEDRKPFPWAVLIWAETSGGPRKNCSGTIIDEKMVVSAASCFWNESSSSLNNVTYTVTGGAEGDSFKQIRQVSNIVLFNYYNSDDEPYTNNVALLILSEAFAFDRLANAVCIYDPDILPQIPVPIQFGGVIVAWTYGIFQEIRQIPLTFAPNKNCPLRNISNVNEVFKFCASAVHLPDALAPMDAGSGFYVIDGGQFYLRGILSPWVEPLQYSFTYIFSNFLPFIPYIKEIASQL